MSKHIHIGNLILQWALSGQNDLLHLPWQVVYATGDAAALGPAIQSSTETLGVYGFTGMLLACGMFGMLLNFSQFLCTMNNSALTTTVVGVMKVCQQKYGR